MEPEEKQSKIPVDNKNSSRKDRRIDNRFRIFFVLSMLLVILSQAVDMPDAEDNSGRYLVAISLIVACLVLLAYVIYFVFVRKKRKR